MNPNLDGHLHELHHLGNDLEEWCEIRVRKDLIPQSSILVEAYLTKNEIVVIGEPKEDDDHNCDVMGCGTLSHVIYRFPLPVRRPEQPISPAPAEVTPNLPSPGGEPGQSVK